MNLQDYIEQHTSPQGEILEQIYRQTNQYTLHPQMLCGPVEGRLLSMLSHMIHPHHILELGTFTGYSALCLAEGLAEGGILDTIEKNDEMEDRIRFHLSLNPRLAPSIHLHIGDAKTLIPTLTGTFDLVFLDADKREYATYYQLLFDRIEVGGYLLADNTLWSGHIIDPAYDKDKQTLGLRTFNDLVANDTRTEQVIVPIRDGLTLIRKVKE